MPLLPVNEPWQSFWERTRKGGLLRYATVSWGATLGIPAGVVTSIFPTDRRTAVTLLNYLANTAGWVVAMSIGGYIAWRISERRYKRTAREREGD